MKTKIEIIKTDITQPAVEAIVNAANNSLPGVTPFFGETHLYPEKVIFACFSDELLETYQKTLTAEGKK